MVRQHSSPWPPPTHPTASRMLRTMQPPRPRQQQGGASEPRCVSPHKVRDLCTASLSGLQGASCQAVHRASLLCLSVACCAAQGRLVGVTKHGTRGSSTLARVHHFKRRASLGRLECSGCKMGRT